MERTPLYGNNYGQAGDLDLYGRRLGLPPAVSLTGSFYFFGPGNRSGELLVMLGVDPAELTELCGAVATPLRVANAWGVEEERDVPIAVCRDPAITLAELWAARSDPADRGR